MKKIPIESTWAEFWKVWFIPPPAPRSAGRQAVHHRRAVGRGEHPHRDADQREHRARTAGRRSRSAAGTAATKLSAGAEHPAGREPARAEAVGEVPGDRPGDQHPDRQRQHVDAGPQRRFGEVVAVLGQPDALQPDDQHEHQSAAGDRGEERRERAERERADAEQRQAEHRSRDAPLDDRERHQARAPAAEQARAPAGWSSRSRGRRRGGCRR